MQLDTNDLFAALLHEMKNNLGLLSLTLDDIQKHSVAGQDEQLYTARLLCERVIDRLRQSLMLYKKGSERFILNVDANSTRDFLRELGETADSLGGGRLDIEVTMDDGVPDIWFFDRNLVEMALVTAVHNSLAYAASHMSIEAGMTDGMIRFSVRDDSEGYPPHILECVAQDKPFSAKQPVGLERSLRAEWESEDSFSRFRGA